MDGATAYDDDILLWSEKQAVALRGLAQSRRDVPNAIDWENVAEEIQSVGRSEFSAVQSFLRLILVHLIEAVSAPENEALMHWRAEAIGLHAELLGRITPSMGGRIDMDALWHRALRQAEAGLAAHGDTIAPALSEACPLGFEEIADPDFDLLAAVRIVRERVVGPNRLER